MGVRDVWIAGLIGGLVGGSILALAAPFLKSGTATQNQAAAKAAVESTSPTLDYVEAVKWLA
jgi:hypothetical protein